MYLEKGTLYRISCGEIVEKDKFAETLLLLINQKSSNVSSGIVDIETVHGTNDILVTVRDSVCTYKMNEYLEQYGEVSAEEIVLGIESISEQRYALEKGTMYIDNMDKIEGQSLVTKLKDNNNFVSYRGFSVDN